MIALLDKIVLLLARTGVSADFIRFGMVGTLGFCCDTATVYGLRPVTGLYGAGAAGFFVAASVNWGLNRLWTFSHKQHDAAHRQWFRFLVVNFFGFIINRGVFFALVSLNSLCNRQPVFAILAGSACGLILNYLLSKRFVFQ